MKEVRPSAKKKRRKRRLIRKIRLICIVLLATLVVGTILCLVVRKVQDANNPHVADRQEMISTDALADNEDLMEGQDKNDSAKTLDAIEDTVNIETSVAEVHDVTMVFTGDICFCDDYSNMVNFRQKGSDITKNIDQTLLNEMIQADICMVNNEFAYSNGGAPLSGKTYTFRANPSCVSILSDMGVDIVSLANNHIYDYGEVALLDTLDTLEGAGIPYVGAGRNLTEASTTYYFEANGRTIAYISATQVERNTNPNTKGATAESAGTFRCYTSEEFARLEAAIKDAEEKADLTVVYIHWGTENTDSLHYLQQEQAGKIVDAGADLIIGDHPHCLQPITYIKNVPVFYSLGNFWFNSKTLDSCLVKIIYTADDQLKCQFVPAKQHDCRTDAESGDEKKRILNYMQCISPDITLDAEGYITNTPYAGPAIDYDAVERVPDPPSTVITMVNPDTGESMLVDSTNGQIMDSKTGLPTGVFVDLTTGKVISP